MKKITLLLLGSFLWFGVQAQTPSYINGTFNINAGVPVVWYGDVTFGPNALVFIEDGATATFYGKNMTVDAAAKFIALPGNNQTGTGNIIFKGSNPLYTNYPLQQTLNGGYSTALDPAFINVEIDNTDGLALSGNVHVSNSIKFTNGHIFLNNFNLVLGSNTNLVNFDVDKHIVTNGIGVLSKEGLANNANFLFPVSIAGTDYTPATVKNTAISARNINVQVKDYTTSAADETTFANKGMDRTWQITASTAGTAEIVLQHNAANNVNGPGTNQSLFNNALSYASQQLTSGVWSQSCTGTNGGTPTSSNQADFTLSDTVDATAYFTKTTVTCADLSITQQVSSMSPVEGNELSFNITVENIGPNTATGVNVTYLLPTGYTFISATSSLGSYNSITGVWTIGNFANSATANLVVRAIVKTNGDYRTVAVIAGAELDPVTTNNSAVVTTIPIKIPSLQPKTFHFCLNQVATSVNLNGDIGAVINWYTSPTGGSASNIAPLPNTNETGIITYYVSQTINGAESDRTEIKIEVHALPEKPTAIEGNNFIAVGTTQSYTIVNSLSTQTYNWILPTDWTGASSTKNINVVVGNHDAIIAVSAVSQFGCISPVQELAVRVVIEDDIEVYNSISPNGDGVNDVFRIRNIDFYPENTLSIFNRWGMEVYHVNSYGQNDNLFKGFSDGRSTVNRDVELPEGTYFYTLTYKNMKGIEKNLSGYLYIKQ